MDLDSARQRRQRRLTSQTEGNVISRGVKEETPYLEHFIWNSCHSFSKEAQPEHFTETMTFLGIRWGLHPVWFGVHCDPHSWQGSSSSVLAEVMALHPYHSFKHPWSFFTWAELDFNFLEGWDCDFSHPLWSRWHLFQNLVLPISPPSPYLVGACPLSLSITFSCSEPSSIWKLREKTMCHQSLPLEYECRSLFSFLGLSLHFRPHYGMKGFVHQERILSMDK